MKLCVTRATACSQRVSLARVDAHEWLARCAPDDGGDEPTATAPPGEVTRPSVQVSIECKVED